MRMEGGARQGSYPAVSTTGPLRRAELPGLLPIAELPLQVGHSLELPTAEVADDHVFLPDWKQRNEKEGEFPLVHNRGVISFLKCAIDEKTLILALATLLP
jgi:hypothetical protein